jgi:hypothetical protein
MLREITIPHIFNNNIDPKFLIPHLENLAFSIPYATNAEEIDLIENLFADSSLFDRLLELLTTINQLRSTILSFFSTMGSRVRDYLVEHAVIPALVHLFSSFSY